MRRAASALLSRPPLSGASMRRHAGGSPGPAAGWGGSGGASGGARPAPTPSGGPPPRPGPPPPGPGYRPPPAATWPAAPPRPAAPAGWPGARPAATRPAPPPPPLGFARLQAQAPPAWQPPPPPPTAWRPPPPPPAARPPSSPARLAAAMSRQLAASPTGGGVAPHLAFDEAAAAAALSEEDEWRLPPAPAPTVTAPPPSPPVRSSDPGGITWNTRSLDWSGETDPAAARDSLLEAGAAAAAAGGRVRVAADLDPGTAVGLWIAVKVGGGEGEGAGAGAVAADAAPSSTTASPSSLYLTVTPLDDATAAAPGTPEPFATAPAGTVFRPPDAPRAGPWLNYRVTLLGGVASVEDEALWPNMVLHGDRAMHNVRHADDVVAFLAAATAADVVSHALNLKALAEHRGRDADWCWELLAARWGAADVAALGLGVSLFDGLPRRRRRQARGADEQAVGEW